MRKVYLAGPIFHASDPSFWRNIAAKSLHKWQTINPLKIEVDVNNPVELVQLDLHILQICQAVLARIDEPSWGTAMEIFHATHEVGIPVIGWRPNSDGPDSPWLLAHTTVIFRSLSQAISHLESME